MPLRSICRRRTLSLPTHFLAAVYNRLKLLEKPLRPHIKKCTADRFAFRLPTKLLSTTGIACAFYCAVHYHNEQKPHGLRFGSQNVSTLLRLTPLGRELTPSARLGERREESLHLILRKRLIPRGQRWNQQLRICRRRTCRTWKLCNAYWRAMRGHLRY
jgi:hypothetical protein